MRAKPIYSVRNDLGQEMTWTTSRKKALETAREMTHGWEDRGRLAGQYGPYYVARLVRVEG